MKKGREKLSEEEVRMVVKAVKEMPVDNIILIPSSKNRTFMSDYKMEEKRWKALLKTLEEDEYDETMPWDRNPQIDLHVFFITRMLASISNGKMQEEKIYIKLGFDVSNKLLVVSFHYPDFPNDERFRR